MYKRQLLNCIKKAGLPCAVATATSRSLTEERLTRLQLIQYFDYICCGDEVVERKPSPEAYLKVLAKMNTAPEDALVFEDSKVGVQAAWNARKMCIRDSNNTKDSCELAAHAESQGVDAIAAIPPIYFHLPEYAIAEYWNDISAAAPNTPFIIYNIPQLSGTTLTMSLYKNMLKNPNVLGVKNSSMATQDIQMFKTEAGKDHIVFNGPDEQFISGRAIGADGGIGGTYAVMPELFLKMNEFLEEGKMKEALEIQNKADAIIYKMCEAHGNLYAVMKEILRINENIDIGNVRKPLPGLIPEDIPIVEEAANMIRDAISELQ